MPIQAPARLSEEQVKLNEDQVKEDIEQVIVVLQALQTAMPLKIDGVLIAALQQLAQNEYLLSLVTGILSKV